MADLYGYSTREPFESETKYFSENPNVAGMGTEDKKIILNPHRTFTDVEKQSVLKNEAIRLWLKDKNITPDFELTPDQVKTFKGTPYEKDELALKHSIISRMLSGDPSAGVTTPDQQTWADKIKAMLEKKDTIGGMVDSINNSRILK